MDELSTVANEMVRLIETATAPILAVDSRGCINGWNAKVSELTGLQVGEAMGKSLVKELVKPEAADRVERVLYLALNGGWLPCLRVVVHCFVFFFSALCCHNCKLWVCCGRVSGPKLEHMSSMGHSVSDRNTTIIVNNLSRCIDPCIVLILLFIRWVFRGEDSYRSLEIAS